MTSLYKPTESVYFKCPYCSLEYDLWKLVGRDEINQMTSVFTCDWKDNSYDGCGKRFVIDLKLIYEIEVTELKE